MNRTAHQCEIQEDKNMAIMGIGNGYNSGIYESANAVKNNETNNRRIVLSYR